MAWQLRRSFYALLNLFDHYASKSSPRSKNNPKRYTNCRSQSSNACSLATKCSEPRDSARNTKTTMLSPIIPPNTLDFASNYFNYRS